MFSAAYSHGLALVAVGRGAELGVDVEWIDPGFAFEGVITSHFTPDERLRIGLLPSNLRRIAFFNIWTQKEALLKAAGVGLTVDIRGVHVEVDPRRAATGNCDMLRSFTEWSMCRLGPTSGFVGCVAVNGPLGQVRTLSFPFGEFEDVIATGRSSGPVLSGTIRY
jgi:4'-phosphopantetheinyl transferase